MSVINQALKDLDKRQRAEQGTRVRSHYQPDTNRPWLWVGALGAGIVLSAFVTWWLVAHALTVSDTSSSGLQHAPEVVLSPLHDDEKAESESPGGAAETQYSASTAVAAPQPAASGIQQADLNQPSTSQQPSTTQAAQNSLTRLHPIAPAAGDSSAPDDNHESSDSESLSAATAAEQTEKDRGEMQVQRVERSASELAAQRLEQAVNAMESGQGRRAETLLQEALVLKPDYIEARQQLAAYYYGRGFTGEALRVLREGLAHTPSNSRLLTLSARIYEETGRADEALNMLNRVSAQLPEQNDILVLRAALANELGQYRSAAEDYRALLGVNPNQGIWWLGLALAEEGRGDFAAAKLAYQRAAEDTALDRASRDYARSREEALSSW